jgi:hypothetical protein
MDFPKSNIRFVIEKPKNLNEAYKEDLLKEHRYINPVVKDDNNY